MADHKVSIKGMKYNPADLEIKAGDRVYWVNEETNSKMEHTATNTNPTEGEVFNTGYLKGLNTEPWMSGLLTFTKTTKYICLKHSTMAGKITVVP